MVQHYKFYFISVIGHILLFVLCISINLKNNSSVNHVGDHAQVLNSFTISGSMVPKPAPVQQEKKTQSSVEHKPSTQARPEAIPLTSQRKPSMMSKRKKIVTSMQKRAEHLNAKSVSGAHSIGEQLTTLLTLLHNQIQKKQQYPFSAESLGREGRVTVAFSLARSGAVNQIKLVQSSGTPSLDQAALAAVRNAAPFVGVEKFIDSERQFQIDVVFELS